MRIAPAVEDLSYVALGTTTMSVSALSADKSSLRMNYSTNSAVAGKYGAYDITFNLNANIN